MIDFPVIDDFIDTEPQRLPDTYVNEARFVSLPKVRSESAMDTIKRLHPRIHQQITMLWGSQELQDAFCRWLVSCPGGSAGWSIEMNEALLMVSNAHAERFGLEGEIRWGEKRDIW